MKENVNPYIDLKKGILLEKIKNHSQPLKLQQIKNLSLQYITTSSEVYLEGAWGVPAPFFATTFFFSIYLKNYKLC